MSIWSGIGHYFVNFFKAISGQLGTKISQFLHDFVQEDLGKLALDAVAYVAATMPNNPDKVAMRDAAVAKFKEDAKAAGHDMTTFTTSLEIFLVESAYQALQAGVKPPTTPAPAPVTTA